MRLTGFMTITLGILLVAPLRAADHASARQALQKATSFLRSISTNGGYVGIYSPDLKERYGEALYERAGGTQIWVQPPGTPSVGQVFLRAYRVTGEQRYLDAAREVGRALAWGQPKQGGWDHRVDVAHLGPDAKTPERKSGHCTFDDDITQGAITFLMELDQQLDETWLDESVGLALEFMMEAQFDNGAWPQWYPLRGGYHDYYTYNDNAINDCIRVMFQAHRLYDEPAYLESARQGGDFIITSQLPAPQAGWAQQYSHDLDPARARGFEPPGVCSAVTARNIRTLIELYLYTGSEKYLSPIPDAIDWLNRSKLAPEDILEREVGQSVDDDDAVWARLYEVQTNKPVYGDRENPRKMIYDIREVSERERSSYGWQGTFGVPRAIRAYRKVKQQGRERILRQRHQTASEEARKQRAASLEPRVDQVISRLDPKGFWLTDGMLRIGTFVRNMNLLCDFLECSASEPPPNTD